MGDCDCSFPYNSLPSCGTPPCGIIRAKTAKKDFPGLRFTPRKEPSRRDRREWEAWKKEYKEWSEVQCPCGKGYFCREHGEWVPGTDVASEIAPPKDQQHKGQCPDWHEKEVKQATEGRDKSRRASSSSRHGHKSKSKSKSDQPHKSSRSTNRSEKHGQTPGSSGKTKYGEPSSSKSIAGDPLTAHKHRRTSSSRKTAGEASTADNSGAGYVYDETGRYQAASGLDQQEDWDVGPGGYAEEDYSLEDDYYESDGSYGTHHEDMRSPYQESEAPDELTSRMTSMQLSLHEEPNYSEEYQASGQQISLSSDAGVSYSQSYDIPGRSTEHTLEYDEYYEGYGPDVAGEVWPDAAYGEAGEEQTSVSASASRKGHRKSRDKGKHRHK